MVAGNIHLWALESSELNAGLPPPPSSLGALTLRIESRDHLSRKPLCSLCLCGYVPGFDHRGTGDTEAILMVCGNIHLWALDSSELNAG